MSAKSPVFVIVATLFCSLLACLICVHLFSQEDLVAIIVCPISLSVSVGIFVFFAALALRDTIRRRGMYGINFRRIVCPQCGTRLRRGITNPDWKELCYGGWTCHECGIELSQWGRPWKVQNPLAKWAILAAKDANERKPRLQRRDERIHNTNDQTQRGDAS